MMPVCIDVGGEPRVIGHTQMMPDPGVREVIIPISLPTPICLTFSGTPFYADSIKMRHYPVRNFVKDGLMKRCIVMPADDDPSMLPGFEPSVYAWGSFPA